MNGCQGYTCRVFTLYLRWTIASSIHREHNQQYPSPKIMPTRWCCNHHNKGIQFFKAKKIHYKIKKVNEMEGNTKSAGKRRLLGNVHNVSRLLSFRRDGFCWNFAAYHIQILRWKTSTLNVAIDRHASRSQMFLFDIYLTTISLRRTPKYLTYLAHIRLSIVKHLKSEVRQYQTHYSHCNSHDTYNLGQILRPLVHHDTDSKAPYWILGKRDITSVMSRRTFGKDEEWRKGKEGIGMRRSHVRKKGAYDLRRIKGLLFSLCSLF